MYFRRRPRVSRSGSEAGLSQPSQQPATHAISNKICLGLESAVAAVNVAQTRWPEPAQTRRFIRPSKLSFKITTDPGSLSTHQPLGCKVQTHHVLAAQHPWRTLPRKAYLRRTAATQEGIETQTTARVVRSTEHLGGPRTTS